MKPVTVTSQGLERVEAYLVEQLSTGHSLVSEPIMALLKAGGKRIRPALVLASASFGRVGLDRLVPLAAAVEIVHMATLVHDDIIDGATTRRGLPTVHAKHGSSVAIFTGDYLFSRAFRLLASYADPDMLRSLAAAVQEICEGEIEQYDARFDTTVSFGDYIRRVRRKTAMLFALACYAGARVAASPEGIPEALRRFGLNLGIAFQIADDLLDFPGAEASSGKPALLDLANGVYTLPIIYALRSPGGGARLRAILSKRDLDEQSVQEVLGIIHDCGAVARASRVADTYAERAESVLRALPDAPGKQVLEDILRSAVRRDR